MYCNKCGATLENAEQEVCTSCGSELYWVGTTEKPPLPMKWHKFLVYFLLIFGAVLNFFSAIATLTGYAYETEGVPADYVYAVFPYLKIVDVVYAVALFAFIAFSLYIWWQLKSYRKNANNYVPVMYAVGSLISIVYELAVLFVMAAAVGMSALDPSPIITGIVTSLVMCIILVWCNKVYYNKRAHLFVN